MPFIKVVKPPCTCNLPNPKDKSIYFGSEWQCEVCGKIYRLEDDQREGRYWAAVIPARKTVTVDANGVDGGAA